MLSYQHAYHAGNLADVHKHALLATMLEYLTRKDKPLSYIETHAGRALYDLSGDEARKTGEAAKGIDVVAERFAPDHPYMRARALVAEAHGAASYPGSPLIAAHLLRDTDPMHLAELHPGEFGALARLFKTRFRGRARLLNQDGFELALSLCPPTPRRGLMLIDPPYEVKTDYTDIPQHIAKLRKAWNVGVIALWYPILRDAPHAPMIQQLTADHPGALRSEVSFAPARPGHGMTGSGMLVIAPPFGLVEAARTLEMMFDGL